MYIMTNSVCRFLLELEQLDEISRRILHQSCPAGTRLTQLSPEFGTGIAQAPDERVYVIRDEHQPVPAAGLGITTSGTSAARTRRAEVEREIVMLERGELTGVVLINLELEQIPIKLG